MTKLRPSFILKMGFSGASPVRYIVTILIAVIAFALFGAAACVGFTETKLPVRSLTLHLVPTLLKI